MVGRWNFPLTWSLFWGHVNFRRDISSLICFSIYIVVLHQVNLEDSQTSGWIPRVQRSHQLSRPDNGMSNPTHVTSPKWNCEAGCGKPWILPIFFWDSKVMIIMFTIVIYRPEVKAMMGLTTWGSSLPHWHHVLRVLSFMKCFDSPCDSTVEINCKASQIHDWFANCNHFQNSNYFQPRKTKTQLVQNQSQFQDHLVIQFNHFWFLPGQILPSSKLVKHLLCFRKALRNRMAARIVVTGRTVPARSGERLAPESRETWGKLSILLLLIVY